MRRQLISESTFQAGFSDSINPLLAPATTWAIGSCNIFQGGESVVRPWKGLYSKGSGSGTNYLTQYGSTWGGNQNYSSVTGQGSLLLDYSNTTFGIGAGRPSKEGTPLQVPISGTTFSTLTFTAAGNILTTAANTFTTGQVVYLTVTGGDTLPSPLVVNTAYWVIALSGTTLSLASSYANAMAGTAITLTTTGAGASRTINYGEPATLSPVLEVLSGLNASYFYTYDDQAGLDQCEAPSVIVPTTPAAAYVGYINGAVNFKIAAIRDRENVGSNLTTPNAPVKGRASGASAVVVPNNKTVKITFPTAQTGQTHWAVFSTKEGFGGTGAFYRLGWRTTSQPGAPATDEWIWGIPETTVAGATDRTLEFDYRTGDLLPELAWVEDYPPQAGTHCIRLENVMIVFGVQDGTVAQVSLPNFFESYNPFHLLYFPEAVTTVLHRPVDNYAFVACRNSIHAVQYVGYRGGDLPSATVTTITPEIGVAYDKNWALGGGNICIFVEGAGLVMMSADGTIDFEFGREVTVFTKSWAASETVVSFDPSSRSFVCSNNGTSVCFCLQTGTWSTPLYLTDAGISSSTTWKSAINSQGKMICTLQSGSTQTAYVFDDNTSTTRMPTCAISQWQTAPLGRSTNIYELGVAVTQGANVEPMVVGLHTNFFKTYLRDCSTTSGSNVLTGTGFTTLYTGMQACLFGTDIGGAGVNYLIVKLTYNSATQLLMTNRSTGSNVNASATLSNVFVLVGKDFFTATPYANISQFDLNFRPAQQNCRAWAVSVFLATDAVTGFVLGESVFGTASESSVVNVI